MRWYEEPISVVKFGGSILEPQNLEVVLKVIERLYKDNGRLVIVVSAFKGLTDSVLANLPKDVSPEYADSVLPLGEVISARLIASALKSRGIPAVYVDPFSDIWPIITDDNFGDANPLLEECKKASKHLLNLIKEGKMPIVAGYAGKTVTGKLTTLGRGGSDTTAIVLARCLGAGEVLLVKDVGAIYSGDPKIVKSSRVLRKIGIEEAIMLCKGGARILHPKALRYLDNSVRVKVAELKDSNIVVRSVVSGDLSELSLELFSEKVLMFTVVALNDTENLIEPALKGVREVGGEVISLSTLEKGLIIYGRGDFGAILNSLHDKLVNKGIAVAISGIRDLALIFVKGKELDVKPGVVYELLKPLAQEGINVYGVQTVLSRIAIFVDWSLRKKAFDLIKSSLGERT
ncbi:MAG: hypothetical protein DRJ41_00015 [Thermoprotei archaeon]|nr:MAG: hypothetical protein DRJ41_00015 [Thermoprotei archaeon]